MKKATILVFFLVNMLSSMAQSITPDSGKPVLTREDYLKKSKDNKTAALVCLIGGGVVFIVGDIIALRDVGNLFTEDYGHNEGLYSTLIIVGGVAMLCSIPLFVAARKNKRMAMSMSFKNEPAVQLERGMVFSKFVPSLSFKISF